MAITKSCISVTDWTAVAQNGMGESAAIDLSDVYEALLHIHHCDCIDGARPHSGRQMAVHRRWHFSE